VKRSPPRPSPWRFRYRRLRRLVMLVAAGCLVAGFLLPANSAGQVVSDKSLTQLIEQLADPNVNARRDAAYELVKRADTSPAVIDAYARGTQDKDNQVQFQSLLGLAHAGPAAEPALPVLLEKMDDRSDQIRYRAADAVGKIGSAALDSILERWPQGSPRFQIAACQAFETMGTPARPAVPVLVQVLHETGMRSRSDGRAPEARAGTRGGDRPRGRNRQRPEANDSRISPYAAAALVAIDRADTATLLLIADHGHAGTRMIGISALAALPSLSPEALERLRESATDDDPQIREISVVVLAKSQIPTSDKEALLELAIVDPTPSVRAAANVAMRRARLGGHAFAQRLADQLPAADRDGAVSVLEALSALGPAAGTGLAQIVAAADRLGIAPPITPEREREDTESDQGSDENQTTESVAAAGLTYEALVKVLSGLGPTAVGDLLTVVQAHPHLEPVVAGALARIGQPAVDALLSGTSSAHPAIRVASVRALGDMQPLAKKSLQRLIEVIGDENLDVRTAAAAALTRAAASNSAAQAALLQAMQDHSPTVRAVAVAALGDGGFSREQRREGFRHGLTDPDAQVRAAALTAIAKTPGQMQRHAELILEQTQAEEDQVRLAALQAMANVPKEVVDNGQFVSVADVQAAVLRGLRDAHLPVRIAATAVVPKLELYQQATLDTMGENLHGSRELVVATLEVLPKFTGDTDTIVARLQPLLGHELSEVRIAAVTALAAADREPLRLTAALVPMLEDREWVVRRIAGQTLGRQGSVAVSAVPKLFELLGRHEDKDYAAESLRQIDRAPVEALRLLSDNLESEDRRKAFYAVTLLGKLGPAAAEALPRMEALLQADSQGGTPLDDFRRNTIKEAIERIKAPVTDL